MDFRSFRARPGPGDIGTVGGKYIVDDWTISSGLKHEHKEGTVIQTIDS